MCDDFGHAALRDMLHTVTRDMRLDDALATRCHIGQLETVTLAVEVQFGLAKGWVDGGPIVMATQPGWEVTRCAGSFH